MADTKVSAFTGLTGPPVDADELLIVDKSDTTQAVSGSTKRILVDELLNKFESATTLARHIPMINSGLLFSAETRDANGVVTSGTIAWSRVVEGAANGVYTGTPNGTYITEPESYTATFPDLSLTISVDFNLDTDGLTADPTVSVA